MKACYQPTTVLAGSTCDLMVCLSPRVQVWFPMANKLFPGKVLPACHSTAPLRYYGCAQKHGMGTNMLLHAVVASDAHQHTAYIMLHHIPETRPPAVWLHSSQNARCRWCSPTKPVLIDSEQHQLTHRTAYA